MDSEDDKWRDEVVDDDKVPLPDPWFLRDLRSRNAEAASVNPSASARAAPGPTASTVRHDDPSADAGRARRRWLPFAIGGVVVAALLLLMLFSAPRVDGPTTPTVVGPEPGAVVVATVAPAVVAERCAGTGTLDRLRRVIVDRAREAGGSDIAHFERQVAGISLKASGDPQIPGASTSTTSCHGSITLAPVGDADAGDEPLTVSISYTAGDVAGIGNLQGISPIVERLLRTGSTVPQADERQPTSALPDRAVPTRQGPVEGADDDDAAPVEARYDDRSPGCDALATRVDRMICSSDRLGRLDREMSRRYAALAASLDTDNRSGLDDSYADFLRRRQLCGDPGCVARAYRDQAAEMEDMANALTNR